MKSLHWLAAAWLTLSTAFAAWQVGDKLEIRWGDKWYPGTVLAVDGPKTQVRYDGYSSAWDEWATPEKLRPRPTPPAVDQLPAPADPAAASAPWKTGDRVEALSYGRWYLATIIASEPARWKVTYDGYGSSSDEWLKLEQLRAPVPKTTATADASPADATYPFPPLPPASEAGLHGAWLRVETFYWSGHLSLNNHGWFFTREGRFSRAPVGGFDFPAFSAATVARRTDGVYSISGDTIILRWADGSTPSAYTFERKGDELVLNGIGAIPVTGFAPGWRLAATYEGGASLGGGAIASSNTLVFKPDGTFDRSTVARISSTSSESTVTAGAQGSSAGTYAFAGHTLTLTHADGSVTTHTVFAFGDQDAAGRPEYLYRDGTMMKKRL